jgi:hypothetical protein
LFSLIILFFLIFWVALENFIFICYLVKTLLLIIFLKLKKFFLKKNKLILKPFFKHWMCNNSIFTNCLYLYFFIKPNLRSYEVFDKMFKRQAVDYLNFKYFKMILEL